MQGEMFVSQPYEDVCDVCRQKKQVILLRAPVDATVYRQHAMLFCEECLYDVVYRIALQWPTFARRL